MGRPATGAVIEPNGPRQPSYAIRFTAYGKRRFVTLGPPPEWNRQRAEEELADALAAVRLGVWQPLEAAQSPEPRPEPTFHEFAEEWIGAREVELRPRTLEDYRWSLELHLLPVFGQMRLAQIDVDAVERFKVAKLRDSEKRRRAIEAGKPLRGREGQVLRPLGANGINKVLDRLAQILEDAVDRELIERNPAKGRRRRLKRTKPQRVYVEVEQLPGLLAAADPYLRPMVATMAGAGLRVSEATRLNWGDIDLGRATLRVRESKTAAGEGRVIDLPIGAVEELATWRAASPRTAPGDPVFVTRARNGVHARQTRRNVLARLKATARRANIALTAEGIAPIDEGLTNHSLRRAYAMLRYACGDDPITVAEQGGWEDPAFPMREYAKAVKRRAKLVGAEARAFDEAIAWAGISAGNGRKGETTGTLTGPVATPAPQQTAA